MVLVLVLVCLALASSVTARSPNIVNGEDVDRPGKYPWQGSMQSSGGWHYCGCSLIDHNWVVTASHCVEGSNAREQRVVFGLHDLGKRYGKPKVYKVSEIIMHENFKRGKGFLPNDIALLRVNEDIEYNEYVQPIKMATSADYSPSDSECVISGWGRMKVGGSYTNPDILQETHTNIITQQACEQAWGSYVPEDGRVVCIKTGKSTSCQGDSGGPLACKKNSGGDFELVGATSWGPADCNVNSPAAYASVPYFLDWINNKINTYVPGEEECIDGEEVCGLYSESDLRNYCNDDSTGIPDICCAACKPYV